MSEKVSLPLGPDDPPDNSPGMDGMLTKSMMMRQNQVEKRKAFLEKLGERRLSFTLTPLDMLKLRPFLRMVREKAMRRRQRGTITPFSTKKTIWNIIFFVLLIYQTFVLPFRLVFHASNESLSPAELIMDFCSDTFFIADLVLNLTLFSVFDKDGRLIYRRKNIFQNYFYSWSFIVHFIAAFPVDWIIWIVLVTQTDDKVKWSAFYFCRLLKLVRFLKLPSIFEHAAHFSPPSTSKSISNNLLKQILWQERKVFFIFLLGLHYFTCLWQALQTDRLTRLDSWTLLEVMHMPSMFNNTLSPSSESFNVTNIHDLADKHPSHSATGFFPNKDSTASDKWGAYAKAAYFIGVSVTGTGFGDIIPADELEVLCSITAVSFGFIVFIFLIGLMISLLKDELLKERVQRQRRDTIELYIRSYKLPAVVGKRVTAYFRFLWTRQEGMLEEQFLANLASRHRTLIVQDQTLHMLQCLPFTQLIEMSNLGGRSRTPSRAPSGEVQGDEVLKQHHRARLPHLPVTSGDSKRASIAATTDPTTPRSMETENPEDLDRVDNTEFFASIDNQKNIAKQAPSASMTELALVSFYRAIAAKMTQETVSPDVSILRKGRANSRLYFMTRGALKMHSSNATDISKLPASACLDCHGPTILGYTSFFCSSNLKVTVVTMMFCDFFILAREDFTTALKFFPTIRAAILAMMVQAEENAMDHAHEGEEEELLPLENYRIIAQDKARPMTPEPKVAEDQDVNSEIKQEDHMGGMLDDHEKLVMAEGNMGAEEVEEDYNKSCTVSPTSRGRQMWNVACFFFSMYYLLVTPFRLTFWRTIDPIHLGWLSVDWLIDIHFIIDFFLRLFVFSYVMVKRNHSYLLNRSCETAKFYVSQSRFYIVVDFISILPVDFVAFLIHQGNDDFAFWLKWIYMYRINHIVRVTHLFEYMADVELAVSTSSSTILLFFKERLQFFKVMFLILTVAHLSACFWALIAFLQAPKKISGGWMKVDELNIFDEELLSYTRSFYFILTTMTTIGYGGIVPTSILEQTVMAVFVLVGCIMYLSVLASLTVIVDDLSLPYRHFERRKEIVGTIVDRSCITAKSREKMRHYLRKEWHMTRGKSEDEIWSMLPAHLQYEVKAGLVLSILEDMSFVTILNVSVRNKTILERKNILRTQAALCHDLTSHVHAVIASPGDHLLNRDEYYNQVYLVQTGSISVSVSSTYASNARKKKIRAGKWFGEEALVSSAAYSDFYYIADSFAHVFVLTANDFHDCVSGYPELRTGLIMQRRAIREDLQLGIRQTTNVPPPPTEDDATETPMTVSPLRSSRSLGQSPAPDFDGTPASIASGHGRNLTREFSAIEMSRVVSDAGVSRFLAPASFRFLLEDGYDVKEGELDADPDVQDDIRRMMYGKPLSNLLPPQNPMHDLVDQQGGETGQISRSTTPAWQVDAEFGGEKLADEMDVAHSYRVIWNFCSLFIIVADVLVIPLLLTFEAHVRSSFDNDDTFRASAPASLLIAVLIADFSSDIFFAVDIYLRFYRFMTDETMDRAFAGSLAAQQADERHAAVDDADDTFLNGAVPLTTFHTESVGLQSPMFTQSDKFQTFNQMFMSADEEKALLKGQVSKAIFSQYLSSMSFILDLIGTLPFNTLSSLLLVGVFEANSTTHAVLLLLRILRGFRLHRFTTYFAEIEQALEQRGSRRVNPLYLRFVRHLIVIMLLAHSSACVWLYIGYNGGEKGEESGWLNSDSVLLRILPQKFPSFYLSALYFVIVTIATIGYGDVQPSSMSEINSSLYSTQYETVFISFLSIFGVVLYSTVTANLAAIATSLGASLARESFEGGLMHQVGTFLDKLDLRSSQALKNGVENQSARRLGKKLKAFAANLWKYHKGVEEDTVLASLPFTLQRHLMADMYMDALIATPLFGNGSMLKAGQSKIDKDDVFSTFTKNKSEIKDGRDNSQHAALPFVVLQSLCRLFSSFTVSRGDVIVQKGDRAKSLVLLFEGEAAVLLDLLSERPLSQGDLYGMTFMPMPGTVKSDTALRHPHTVVAKTLCRVSLLPYDAIKKLCEMYPTARPVLQRRWNLYFNAKKQPSTAGAAPISPLRSPRSPRTFVDTFRPIESSADKADGHDDDVKPTISRPRSSLHFKSMEDEVLEEVAEPFDSDLEDSKYDERPSFLFTVQPSTMLVDGDPNTEIVLGADFQDDKHETFERYGSLYRKAKRDAIELQGLYMPQSTFRVRWGLTCFILMCLFIPLYPSYFSVMRLSNNRAAFLVFHGIWILYDIFFAINLYFVLRRFVPKSIGNENVRNITSQWIMNCYLGRDPLSSDSAGRVGFNLFMDLLGCFPFGLLLLLGVDEPWFDQWACMLRLNTLVFFMWHARDFGAYFVKVLDENDVSVGKRRIMQSAGIVLLLLHYMASVWLSLGHANLDVVDELRPRQGGTWLMLRGGQPMEAPLASQYLFAYYFTFSTMTTVGYGDITPQNSGEIIFVLFFILLCTSVYGGIIGSVAIHIANSKNGRQSDGTEIANEMFLDTYCQMRSVSIDLHKKLWQYHNEMKKQQDVSSYLGGHEDFALLRSIPKNIQYHTAHFMLKGAIEEVPFFAPFCSDYAFLSALALKFVPEIFIPGEYLIRVGDIGNEMFLIMTGRVTVLLFENITEGRQQGGKSIHNVMRIRKKVSLESPIHIGETSFFSHAVRTSSILCTSFVKALKLPRESFDSLMEEYPEYQAKIHDEFLISAMLVYDDIQPMLRVMSNQNSRRNSQDFGSSSPVMRMDSGELSISQDAQSSQQRGQLTMGTKGHSKSRASMGLLGKMM